MIASDVKIQLINIADEKKVSILQRFFKTGKGEYGEGDKFLGILVPLIRVVAKQNKEIGMTEIISLLKDPWHECRLCALLILTEKFKKAEETLRRQIYEVYLNHTTYINNWDLVDLSCRDIVGEYLIDKDRSPLYQLSGSKNLWEQRIAIVSTFAFIRRNDLNDTFLLSEKLLEHKHDLIHKAVGWMLREAGKKDEDRLTQFLQKHYTRMPRTMLRYAIEKFPEEKRAFFMKKD
ncbi:MAG: DNA alkylation repair protein [Candidatus Azobacteroides sp.]|nr:DNA alkylation repair protein [Candidatus Azobacteroides sp.]